MYRLITTHYYERHARRRAELEFCLSVNRGQFDEVTILSEGAERPAGFRGNWFVGFERQRYSDLIALAAHGEPRDLVVLANSDVILPRPELDVIAANMEREQVYALTRWDVTTKHGIRLFDAVYSQDVWVFRGAPKQAIGGDYPLGVPGCDNRFAAELEAAGYAVLNPSQDIHAYHFHQSGHRTSNKPENRVALPYLFVKPAHLGEAPAYRRPTRVSKRASQFQQ